MISTRADVFGQASCLRTVMARGGASETKFVRRGLRTEHLLRRSGRITDVVHLRTNCFIGSDLREFPLR